MKKKADTSKALRDFQGFVKRLLAVPKSELEEKLRQDKARKPRKNGTVL